MTELQQHDEEIYIIGEAMAECIDNFGNRKLRVLVIENKNYPMNINHYKNQDFVFIKTRLLREITIIKGEVYKFQVIEMDTYKNNKYITKMDTRKI